MERDRTPTSIRGPVADHQHLQGHGGLCRNRPAETGLAAGTLPTGAVRGPGVQTQGQGHRDLQVRGAGDGGQGEHVDCKEHQQQRVLPVRLELQVLHRQRLQGHGRELEAAARLRHREDRAEPVQRHLGPAGIQAGSLLSRAQELVPQFSGAQDFSPSHMMDVVKGLQKCYTLIY